MESQYKVQRTRNLYKSTDIKPYKISRSKIEDFLSCKRCFYLDRKCGTDRPPMFPYTLNNAVDKLLKSEFDVYRTQNKPHPYFVEYGIDAVPFQHEDLEDWRMNQRGIKYHHKATNFMVTGAVDDVWVNSDGEKILIVDYKATSTKDIPTLENRDSYKRQMEIYQWLFRQNRFKVFEIGYFVYCNGDTSKEMFDQKLHFNTSVLEHKGDDSWVESTLFDIKKCLMSNELPKPSQSCDYCAYWFAVKGHVDKYN